jgi:hypothetical protein
LLTKFTFWLSLFGLAIANCGFAGSSCAKASAVVETMAGQAGGQVFFDIATKWQTSDIRSEPDGAGAGWNVLNQAIPSLPPAPTGIEWKKTYAYVRLAGKKSTLMFG